MYAVLHPPNFAAQVIAQQRTELRKRPFALIDGEPPADTVVAANKAARGLGVEVGMTRLQAATIPEVVAIRRVPEDELSAQSILHTLACMFSPRIENIEAHPGTYVLDIRGMNGMFGDETQLANKLRQRTMTEGFLANVAVAENFDAALCLALGRIGVSVVPPGDEAKALRDLPLHVLHPTVEQAATFEA
jgi:protein ImuB